ncbi:hypothetical protein DPMN_007410 [Dreissena polymorpha]|uniref:Uncharacterized protein n=1 Tax=Dreissena polymorpha TaxID=45954 RepID=A0A9D4RYC6_DREPO|nr:hypothetical protein DPMN_007410 [Dreissena polymorpha]
MLLFKAPIADGTHTFDVDLKSVEQIHSTGEIIAVDDLIVRCSNVEEGTDRPGPSSRQIDIVPYRLSQTGLYHPQASILMRLQELSIGGQ